MLASPTMTKIPLPTTALHLVLHVVAENLLRHVVVHVAVVEEVGSAHHRSHEGWVLNIRFHVTEIHRIFHQLWTVAREWCSNG